MKDVKVAIVNFPIKYYNSLNGEYKKVFTNKYNNMNLVKLKVSICLDDWREIWTIQDINLWVRGDSLAEIEKNINIYLEDKTLRYEILFQNIRRC